MARRLDLDALMAGQKPRRHADDLRGIANLVVTATKGVTAVVEDMHRTIASGPAILGRPLSRPVGALMPLFYGPVRSVTGLVGTSIDLVLSQLGTLLGESVPGAERDAVVAALNGVLGDHLEQTGNSLAIPMSLRAENRPLSRETAVLAEQLAEAKGKALVLLHGSAMSDRQWNRSGHDHGAALARDLGYTPIYVRYNSGLHISTNGRALSECLETLVNAWPGAPSDLTLLGFSMGGLVARAACHAASLGGHRWPAVLRRLVCMGSPHHGSPLERRGNLVDALLGISAYSAPLARLAQIRSAGVTDLRFGNVRDEDWKNRARFAWGRDLRHGLALPNGVACFAIAGTLTNTMADKLLGDGLVPVDSALGRHQHPELTLAFPKEHQWVALGTGHMELLSSGAVYEKLRRWLAD